MSEFTAYDIFVQLLAVVALVLNVVSFQLKSRRRLLLIGGVVCVLLATHFFLLGAYTASAMFFIAIFRVVLFAKYSGETKRPLWPLVLIMGLFLVGGFLTLKNPVGLLPILSTFIVSIGLWQTDTQRIRKIIWVGPILWSIHNIAVGSIGGVLNEVFNLASILIGLWRHRKQTNDLSGETP